ncbi:MAG: 23S rRNA (uridine(2552)-2'-O)-methyltransferase RlmE [bacterium]
MAVSKSSRRWLDEHFNDEYVLRAQREGYRSRAAFKLIELDDRYGLLKKGMSVVDLGAAPGGWSEVVANRLQENGRVIASDILDMSSIAGVDIVKGDFREDSVLEEILKLLGSHKADLVISDMAPNMSGVDSVDLPKAMYLVELAVDLADRTLAKGGSFLSKVFQGEGFDPLMADLKGKYGSVVVRKPASSRPRSREVYVLARGFR